MKIAVYLLLFLVLRESASQDRCGLLPSCTSNQCCLRVGFIRYCSKLVEEGRLCGSLFFYDTCPCAEGLTCESGRCRRIITTTTEMPTTTNSTVNDTLLD